MSLPQESKSKRRADLSKAGTAVAQEYIRNSKTISGRLNDELVMMDIDQGKYFSLNPVATRIWDLLEKKSSLEALCRQLIEEYDVSFELCVNEVEEYLREMKDLGLVLEIDHNH